MSVQSEIDRIKKNVDDTKATRAPAGHFYFVMPALDVTVE